MVSIEARAETRDIIGAFSSFCDAIMKRFSRHHIIRNTGDIYLSKTNNERSVIQFIHLQQVHSAFCFLHFKCVEKNGRKILKINFLKESCL